MTKTAADNKTQFTFEYCVKTLLILFSLTKVLRYLEKDSCHDTNVNIFTQIYKAYHLYNKKKEQE